MGSPEAEAVREHLIASVSAHGVSLCLDHRRVERLLLADFPDRPWPVVALHAATREGVAADLALSVEGGEAGAAIPGMAFERFVRRLLDQAGLSKGSAAWAVACWAEALGRQPPEQSPRLRGAPMRAKANPRIAHRPGEAPWHLRGHRKQVSAIDFNLDGSLAATSSIDRTVRLWDTRTGTPAAVLMGGHRDWVRAVAFSPDGKLLASGGDDGAIRLWDPLTGERKFRLVGHEGWVRGLCWSPDSRLVVSGGRDGMICLWEVASLQLLAKLGPLEGGVSRVAFDPNGRWLAAGRTNAVEIWDLERVDLAQTAEVAGSRTVVVAGRGERVYIGDERGGWCWSVAEGRYVQAFDGHQGPVRALAVHPNGKSLVTAGRDQVVRLWHAVEGWEAYAFQFRNVRLTALGFHPAGHIGVGFSDGNAQIREMVSGPRQPSGAPKSSSGGRR